MSKPKATVLLACFMRFKISKLSETQCRHFEQQSHQLCHWLKSKPNVLQLHFGLSNVGRTSDCGEVLFLSAKLCCDQLQQTGLGFSTCDAAGRMDITNTEIMLTITEICISWFYRRQAVWPSIVPLKTTYWWNPVKPVNLQKLYTTWDFGSNVCSKFLLICDFRCFAGLKPSPDTKTTKVAIRSCGKVHERQSDSSLPRFSLLCWLIDVKWLCA